MNDELRTYALDEMHHRIRQVRAYSLPAEGGSKITVHAALVKSDPPTGSNPANQETLAEPPAARTTEPCFRGSMRRTANRSC